MTGVTSNSEMPVAAGSTEPIRRSKIALIVIGAWTIPVLLSTLETVTFSRMAGHPVATWRAFVSEAPQWYMWALFTPLITRLGRRFRLDREIRTSSVVVHLLVSVVASFVVALASGVTGVLLKRTTRSVMASTMSWFIGGLPATTVVYFSILGIGYALFNTIRLRDRERQAAQLSAQLSEAQLAALRMQLQPHFLFNSLNAIMALVRDADSARSIEALSLLSDTLRASLSAGSRNEVTLREEMDFIQRYLGIERIRFGERLKVAFDVDPRLQDAVVPVFVLQPFVENALRHGLAPERGGGEIRISAVKSGESLNLTVEDNGVGLANGARPHRDGGVGIPNAQSRLEHMYNGRAILNVQANSPDRGVTAKITIPLRMYTGAPT